MTAWRCASCRAANAETVNFCEACGAARALAPTLAPPATGYVPPWKRPGWKDSKPDDPCGEPGCTMTIREHIEAFKQAGDKILSRAVRL